MSYDPSEFVVLALIRDVIQKCHEAEGFDPLAISDWNVDEREILAHWLPRIVALAPEQSTGVKAAQINAAPEVGAPTGAVDLEALAQRIEEALFERLRREGLSWTVSGRVARDVGSDIRASTPTTISEPIPGDPNG